MKPDTYRPYEPQPFLYVQDPHTGYRWPVQNKISIPETDRERDLRENNT